MGRRKTTTGAVRHAARRNIFRAQQIRVRRREPRQIGRLRPLRRRTSGIF